MHSITPILRRLSQRVPDAPGEPRESLDPEESQALWGAVLDGALPELELGALLASLSMAGETTAELLGLHRALATRQAKLSPVPARRAIAMPAYGLVPGEAAFSVLLALFLRRFDVPVVMHGPLDAGEVPSAAMLLRELGVLPSVTIAEAERELRETGFAFVPVQLLSPALGDLIALRTRLGATNPAHLAAHALDPGAMGTVRLATCVAGTRSERLAALVPATGGKALLLEWPAAAPGCKLAWRPRITRISEGSQSLVFEAETGERSPAAAPAEPDRLVAWMRAVIDRRAPAPPPLVNLAAACVHAAGAASDLTQAKAVVALQSGRLAA
jgi:anthranilate phosphoribosyltransferase